MFAIRGLPGSNAHKYQHFTSKQAAENWLDAAQKYAKKHGLGIQTYKIISDKAALKIRFRDGSRVYSKDAEENYNEE